MVNMGLEILFWLTLISYIVLRLTQPKKGLKQQY